MRKSVQDAAATNPTDVDRRVSTKLTDFPLLTTRRACIVADCSRSTLQRTGPEPVGRRGRTFIYKTADILAWLTGGIERQAERTALRPERRVVTASADALERLARVAGRGGAR
jgi:hypothetical protein